MSDFDIAISFAGEDRTIAEKIATSLREQYGFKVFYDDFAQADLIGECLTEYLTNIYKNKSDYCVIIVSVNYVNKRYTKHEWRAAQARALEEIDRAYIIPVRLDDSELPGLLPTIGYISLSNKGIDRTIELISEKVKIVASKNEKVRRAYKLHQQGNNEKALDVLQSENLTSNFEAMLLLSKIMSYLGKYEESISALASAIKIEPLDPEIHFLLGVYHFRLGKFRESVPFYQRALELRPNHLTAQLDLRHAKLFGIIQNIPIMRRFVVANLSANKLRNKNK